MQIEKAWELPFNPERVFDAWISSDTVIPPATHMDIDPVVGGHYRLVAETPEFSAKNEGEFLIVERPSHLRYTWEWNKDGEVSSIDVRFEPNRTGTHVRLLHSGFTHQGSVDAHASGWESYMKGLGAYLRGRGVGTKGSA